MKSISYFSEAGPKGHNQDSVRFSEIHDGAKLIAIADGVGGNIGGGAASKTAVDVVQQLFQSNSQLDISEYYSAVKSQLDVSASKDSTLERMATTLSICIIECSGRCRVGHVGDSRVYHLRGKGLITLTEDQTERQELLNAGVISKRRAANYHRRNILVSAMSPNYEYELAEIEVSLQTGDRLLLVTDGVYEAISKKEIRDLSLSSESVEVFCERLHASLLNVGPADDYTALCYEF
ncbi:MAG: protein phosphatase 2C domain-containing protein [Gammaproteobacteria bacterium]